MALAAAMAVRARAHLPLALVWLNNPLTLPLLIYAGYQAGILLTGQPAAAFEFEASLRWFRQSIVDIGLPLLLGSVLLGLFSALASALLLRRGWLFALRLKRRRRRRSPLSQQSKGPCQPDAHKRPAGLNWVCGGFVVGLLLTQHQCRLHFGRPSGRPDSRQ
jgi:uncharacterized protein (DUF2062 family)